MRDRSWSPVHLPDEFPPPVGAYSPAARVGDLVFVSGQVPRDPRTGETIRGDIRVQTRAALANTRRVLESAGATLGDVVAITAYLQRMEDWEAFNEEYRAAFSPPYPTRTTVGADLRGFLVEITAIAVTGRG
jgi:2-iminobutanoate/2-iminopropanoate deaminase